MITDLTAAAAARKDTLANEHVCLSLFLAPPERRICQNARKQRFVFLIHF